MISISPIYDSPQADNGCDVRNYQEIDQSFGTMENFDQLVAEAHKCGLKIVMDLVVNHTSDEPTWFKEAKKSKENPYRDFYIWRDGKQQGAT